MQLPTDRVAVLSYDSHLKLRLDFTNDRAAIHRALFETLKIGGAPDPPPPSPFPSLAAHFDVEAARKASSVEKGLFVTAQALEKIPGGKVMLFLGWGLHVNRAPVDARWNALAINALQQARVNVFTLDITDAVERLNALALGGLLVTAVHVEGRMSGPDLKLVEMVADRAAFPVIASGGIASMKHLRSLDFAGAAASVIGMALYTGTLNARAVAEEFSE